MMNLEHEKFFREFSCSRMRTMKDMLKPSLQRMSMVKTAIELWNENDVRKSILKYKFADEHLLKFKEWREINKKVLDKVTQLSIPERLKREFLSLISPIGDEIKNWWRFHQLEINVSKWPDQLVWTLGGTIDRKKTAELLVKDENLELDTRYKIACVYCLEKKIPELWKRIPEEQKQYFLSKQTSKNTNVNKLVIFWTHHLFGEASDLEEIIRSNEFRNYPPHVYVFHPEVNRGNAVAIEFFFDKLSDEQKNAILVRYPLWAPQARLHTKNVEEYYSEVFFYLLSKMNEARQVQLFELCPFGMLSCFLDRPFQPFFKPLAERIMANRPIFDHTYVCLLLSISGKIVAGGKDFDYGKLFCNFWNVSPVPYRRLATDTQELFSSIVINLLEVGEKSIIEMLFKQWNALDKEWLISGEGVVPHLVCRESWDLVEVLFEMGEMTEEAIIETKDALMSRFLKSVQRNEGEVENDYEINNREYDTRHWFYFFNVLNELITLKSNRKC